MVEPSEAVSFSDPEPYSHWVFPCKMRAISASFLMLTEKKETTKQKPPKAHNLKMDGVVQLLSCV